jgi:hypothetical protein
MAAAESLHLGLVLSICAIILCIESVYFLGIGGYLPLRTFLRRAGKLSPVKGGLSDAS